MHVCLCVYKCVTNGWGTLVELEGSSWVERMTEKEKSDRGKRWRETDEPPSPANSITWLGCSDQLWGPGDARSETTHATLTLEVEAVPLSKRG